MPHAVPASDGCVLLIFVYNELIHLSGASKYINPKAQTIAHDG